MTDRSADDGESASLELRDLTAEPMPATEARIRFAQWLAGTAVAGERAYDVVLAVYEAMANVVEHAYDDGAAHRSFDVTASMCRGHLVVAVSDHGSWSPPSPGSLRGRGVPLMTALADDITTSCSESGTTVSLTWGFDTGA